MRTDGVRHLIAKAEQDGEVALTPLGGMDLCTLGGPRHAVFPDVLAGVWVGMDTDERDEFITHSTSRLVRENLLVPVTAASARSAYAMSPELGIVIAARSRPAFVLVAQVPGTVLPTLSMFALAVNENQGQPGHLILTETLMKLPQADSKRRPEAAGARLLGCVYGYHLLTMDRAAAVLTDWAVTPTEKHHRLSREPPRVIVRYQPADERRRIGYQLTVRGDGTSARVRGVDPGDANAERTCGRDEIQAVMTGLLAGKFR
jgi:hypothetical protein